MKAMNYRGPFRVRVEEKPMPQILHPEDAIVQVTRACICGSDLHLYHGMVPDTHIKSTFGHEFIDIIREVGSGINKLKVGDWKYDKQRLMKNVATMDAVSIGVLMLIRRK